MIRAAQPSEDLKEKVTETKEVFKSSVAQLLGVRGGERTTDIWKIRLQLTKPVTWVPLIWGKCSVPCFQSSLCRAILLTCP